MITSKIRLILSQFYSKPKLYKLGNFYKRNNQEKNSSKMRKTVCALFLLLTTPVLILSNYLRKTQLLIA